MKIMFIVFLLLFSNLAYADFSIETITGSTSASVDYSVDNSSSLAKRNISIKFKNTGTTSSTINSFTITPGPGEMTTWSINGDNWCQYSVRSNSFCTVNFQTVSSIPGGWPDPIIYHANISAPNLTGTIDLELSVKGIEPIYSFEIVEDEHEFVFLTGSPRESIIKEYTIKNTGTMPGVPEVSLSPDMSGTLVILNRCAPVLGVNKTCKITYSVKVPPGQNYDQIKTLSVGYGGVVQDTARWIINTFKPYKITAVGADHKLYQSINYGTSFSELSFGYAPTGMSVYNVSGPNMAANLFGTGNSVQVSSNSGTTFAPVTIPGASRKSVSLSGSNMLSVTYDRSFHQPGYITSDYNSVQLSQDLGTSFSQVALPTGWNRALYGQVEGSKVLLVDAKPMKVALSSDSGVSFQEVTLPLGVSYVEQVLINGNNILLFATKDALNQANGTMLSRDGGLTFESLPMPTANISDITQVGMNAGYVFFKVYNPMSLSSSLMLTRNRGLSYQTIQNPASNADMASWAIELN